ESDRDRVFPSARPFERLGQLPHTTDAHRAVSRNQHLYAPPRLSDVARIAGPRLPHQPIVAARFFLFTRALFQIHGADVPAHRSGEGSGNLSRAIGRKVGAGTVFGNRVTHAANPSRLRMYADRNLFAIQCAEVS